MLCFTTTGIHCISTMLLVGKGLDDWLGLYLFCYLLDY